ncbi:MAG TPA: DUF3089 domain-containing protein [Solirubrobacteraceae bacterium]|jgi:hypothetical protein
MIHGDGGRGFTRRSARGLAAALALVVAVMLASAAVAGAKGATVWLCKPGAKPDPCTADRSTTAVSYEGTTRREAVVKQVRSGRPQVDCFYVYPTVSEQVGPNADLTIEPQQTQIAIDQASRFSQVCRVFAPVYRQLTLPAIHTPGAVTPASAAIAYLSMRNAWSEYLKHFNKGRPIVLIGHSQGTLLLAQLIKEQFDPSPALRKQLVSAILLGGNVLVPEGESVGGSFLHVPACAAATDFGCVIAYSSFLKEPPEDSFFGRPNSPLLGTPPPPGMQVLCVNPTLLTQNGATGALLPYAPTTPFPGTLGSGTPTPSASTPWVQTQGAVTAQCRNENGASWLQIGTREGLSQSVVEDLASHNEAVEELSGPEWGLHLYDVNIALGNLVNTVSLQTAAYGFAH